MVPPEWIFKLSVDELQWELMRELCEDYGYVVEGKGAGMVRKYGITTASAHDGKMRAPMLSGDEDWAFGDKAYGYAENSGFLERIGVGDGLMRRHYMVKSTVGG